MSVSRRTILKGIVAAGAAAAAGASVPKAVSAAREPKKAPADAVGMLYDATKCIGCKTCVQRCKEANKLPPDTQMMGGIYDAPIDLNGKTKNIIKLYKGEDGKQSYMKRQCMHCLDPSCASVCMVGSYKKREYGIVTWDPSRCIGCRTCMVACHFNIPKMEWDSNAPKIVKCEMCNHLLKEGKIPGCCEVCPRQAVIYGKYTELLADAKSRLAMEPNRYFPKIYGENDAGGTQVLYLSAAGIPFEKLGLPNLGTEPVPATSEVIQHGIYQGFVAPIALYAVLAGVLFRNRKALTGKEGAE